ncbi:uncharacterized protein EI90DRAFT_2654636 [Cantharellus anzutake]|uniref:uncharacterized protein n=1 Tax=Cantharellus anzutake TaxID=1750568 RepID=UPI001907D272|nr:uncharacterized protein EI90DRAFT_2654636 [Cantharellus anzutake]KAF8337458.1 hypothetical protein EI90DRAFT_2654636 [Cantharellus anzutake]
MYFMYKYSRTRSPICRGLSEAAADCPIRNPFITAFRKSSHEVRKHKTLQIFYINQVDTSSSVKPCVPPFFSVENSRLGTHKSSVEACRLISFCAITGGCRSDDAPLPQPPTLASQCWIGCASVAMAEAAQVDERHRLAKRSQAQGWHVYFVTGHRRTQGADSPEIR